MPATIPSFVSQKNAWEQVRVFVNEAEVSVASMAIALKVGQPNVLRIEAPETLGRAINLGIADNGAGLTINAAPEFNSWVPLIDGKASWTLTPDGQKRGRLTFVLYTREVTQAWSPSVWVMSPDWSKEVDILMNLSVLPQPPEGRHFWPGTKIDLHLRPKPASSFLGYPVVLEVVPKGTLKPDPISSKPDLGTKNTQHRWIATFTKDINGGYFDFKFTPLGLPSLTITNCSVSSSNLRDEAIIKLDGVEFLPGDAIFIGSNPKTLTVTVKPGRPPFSSLWLHWADGGGGMNGSLFKSVPPFADSNSTCSWRITCPKAHGRFVLRPEGWGMKADLPCQVLN